LRWIATDAPEDEIHEAARKAGGHATLFRGGQGSAIMRLDPGVLALNKRIKAALDPSGIFGPHRLHAEF
jgi:glycolate oxidase FAD binding subunit